MQTVLRRNDKLVPVLVVALVLLLVELLVVVVVVAVALAAGSERVGSSQSCFKRVCGFCFSCDVRIVLYGACFSLCELPFGRL